MPTIMRLGIYDTVASNNARTAATQTENVKENVSFVDYTGNIAHGTMPDLSGTNKTILTGESYTLPEGYYNGNVITAGDVTTLWTNSNPSSNFPSSGNSIDITLSEPATNFNRIRVAYKIRSSDSNDNLLLSEFIVKDAYEKYRGSTNYNGRFAIGIYQTDYSRVRTMFFLDSGYMLMRITTAYRINASGTSGSYAIPVYIYGVDRTVTSE